MPPTYFVPCRQAYGRVSCRVGPGDKSEQHFGGPKQRHEQHPKLGLKKVLLAVFAICAVSAICAVACCCAPAFKTARIGCNREDSPLGSLDSAAREALETLHTHETNAGNDSSFGPVVTLDVTAKSPTPDDPSTQPEGPAPYLLQCDMAVTVPLNLTNAVAAFPQTKSAQLSASGFPAASPVRDFASQLFVAAHCDPAAPRVPEGPAPTADLPSPQQCPALPTLHKALLEIDSFRKHLAVVPHGPEARVPQGVQRQGPALPASPESTKAPSCDQLPWWLRRGGVHTNGSPAAYDFFLMPPQPVHTVLVNGSTHHGTAAPDLRHVPPATLTLGFPLIAPADAPIAAKEHDHAWDPQDGASAVLLAGAAAPGPDSGAGRHASVDASASFVLLLFAWCLGITAVATLWRNATAIKSLLRRIRWMQCQLHLARSERERAVREQEQGYESVIAVVQEGVHGSRAVATALSNRLRRGRAARNIAMATAMRYKALAAKFKKNFPIYVRRTQKLLRMMRTHIKAKAAAVLQMEAQAEAVSAQLKIKADALVEKRSQLAASNSTIRFLISCVTTKVPVLRNLNRFMRWRQEELQHGEAEYQDTQQQTDTSNAARAEAESLSTKLQDRQLALRERLHSASAENAALGSKAANLAAKLQHTESLLFQAWAGQGPSSVTGERREG